MKVKIKISRFDRKKDTKPYIKEYLVPYQKEMTILDALRHIGEKIDTTLGFRYECKKSTCGTCGVSVNNKAVLACSTKIDPKKVPLIEPLANFNIIKDLVVDLEPYRLKLKQVRPFLENNIKNSVIKSKKEANMSKKLRECIECWLCTATSKVVKDNKNTVADPVCMVKLARFKQDPRDEINRSQIAKQEGLKKYENEINKISKICPKGIDILEAIKILNMK